MTIGGDAHGKTIRMAEHTVVRRIRPPIPQVEDDRLIRGYGQYVREINGLPSWRIHSMPRASAV